MATKRSPTEQQSLFGEIQIRSLAVPTKRKSAPAASAKPAPESTRKWSMPEPSGSTVAEVRLRWNKRLTPAQVARIESELGALPRLLGKLGFGPVLVERTFVRRQKKG